MSHGVAAHFTFDFRCTLQRHSAMTRATRGIGGQIKRECFTEVAGRIGKKSLHFNLAEQLSEIIKKTSSHVWSKKKRR